MHQELLVRNIPGICAGQREGQAVARCQRGNVLVARQHVLGRAQLPDQGDRGVAQHRRVPATQHTERVIVPLRGRGAEVMGAAAGDRKPCAVAALEVQHVHQVPAAAGADIAAGLQPQAQRLAVFTQQARQAGAEAGPVERGFRRQIIHPEAAAGIHPQRAEPIALPPLLHGAQVGGDQMQLRAGVALVRHQVEMEAFQPQRGAGPQALHRRIQIVRVQAERRGLPAHHQARALRTGHGDVHAQEYRHAAPGLRRDGGQAFQLAQAFHMHGAVGQRGSLGQFGIELARAAEQQRSPGLLPMQPGQFAAGGRLEAIHVRGERLQDRWFRIGLGRVEQLARFGQLRAHPGRMRIQSGQVVDIGAQRAIALVADARQCLHHCVTIDAQAHAATRRVTALRGIGLGSAV